MCIPMNCNGKTIASFFLSFFRNVFYKYIKGKLDICSLLVMSIGDDWMIDMMITYIEKIITKAFNINDNIKQKWGCQLNESSSLNK